MKLIINTSNIVIGGGIQVSLSFIEELKKISNNEYHIFLSKEISLQLDLDSFPNNFKFYKIEQSPSALIKGRKIRRVLSELEADIQPDLVFTVFGPAYWKPESIHISGFADGWCYTPHTIAYNRLSFLRKIRVRALIKFKNYLINKSDILIVETQTAKLNIVDNLKISSDRIFVVGNTYHSIFSQYKKQYSLEDVNANAPFKLLSLSSFYPHKNLEIINSVIAELKIKSTKSFKFYLTIKEEQFEENFVESDYLENLGPLRISECPKVYDQMNALFLPTLLETFTANYPEAMKMGRPILTSKLDFAEELCGDAALYFNPMSPADIADKIILLSNNISLQMDLVMKGKEKLKTYNNSYDRANQYLEVFNQVLK